MGGGSPSHLIFSVWGEVRPLPPSRLSPPSPTPTLPTEFIKTDTQTVFKTVIDSYQAVIYLPPLGVVDISLVDRPPSWETLPNVFGF